jgi:hypothetical protein
MHDGAVRSTRSVTFKVIPVVLPSQYLRGHDARFEPHKRLMAAVLQTAVDDRWGSLYRHGPRHGTPAEIRGLQKAMTYLASTDRAWPFSFENLCEALGLDPTSLREKLQQEPGICGKIQADQSKPRTRRLTREHAHRAMRGRRPLPRTAAVTRV